MSAKRINITIEEDAADKLLEMAGSERKQGEFVAWLVDEEHKRRMYDPSYVGALLELFLHAHVVATVGTLPDAYRAQLLSTMAAKASEYGLSDGIDGLLANLEFFADGMSQ